MKEANITIGGVPLTEGQSMTIRVALQNFALDLHASGLGRDETGKVMADAYLTCILLINGLIAQSAT